MARVRSRVNRKLASQITSEAEYRRVMYDHAKDVATAARRNTPRKTGTAQRSIAITYEDGVYRVGGFDPFFHLIEFGSIHNPAYAPLRRGVIGAGLKLSAI